MINVKVDESTPLIKSGQGTKVFVVNDCLSHTDPSVYFTKERALKYIEDWERPVYEEDGGFFNMVCEDTGTNISKVYINGAFSHLIIETELRA